MLTRLSLLRSNKPLQIIQRCKSATSAAEVSSAASKANAPTTTTSVPVATCLLAAAAGVTTVSAAAAVMDMSTASSCPPYDPSGQRFDQSNFMGRFSRMILQCDPRLLLYPKDQVLASKHMIENYKEYPDVSDRALWEARRMCEAALNDEGEFIPRPFRMSGYVPYNGPICVAMVASTSTPTLLFWSWANQSQNALINYYNRNSSSKMTNETLAKSYTAAVGSALTVAFGLATLIQKRYSPDKAKALLRYVAFPSAVVASTLNCYIVRSPEIETGIPLQDAEGRDVLPGSTSQVAATAGVYSTTASRALLQAPVYFVPPVLLAIVPPFKKFLAKKPAMTVPLTTYLVLTSFGVGLPATVAIFPQISEIAAHDVEERFQHLRNPETNQPYKVFYYNKGL